MKNEFLGKVFRWFGIGLFITFLVGFLVSTNLELVYFIFSGYAYIVIFLLEIGLALWLTTRIHRMSSRMVKGIYIGYSALTGLTFSSIFIVYEVSSIIWIFLVSALIFFAFSLLGKSNRFDLSRYGTYLLIGLLGMILLGFINMFLLNEALDMVICIITFGIFVFYVAYDVQKIIRNYDATDQMAVFGAFDLYLDFINIFLRLLQLFGRQKD